MIMLMTKKSSTISDRRGCFFLFFIIIIILETRNIHSHMVFRNDWPSFIINTHKTVQNGISDGTVSPMWIISWGHFLLDEWNWRLEVEDLMNQTLKPTTWPAKLSGESLKQVLVQVNARWSLSMPPQFDSLINQMHNSVNYWETRTSKRSSSIHNSIHNSIQIYRRRI